MKIETTIIMLSLLVLGVGLFLLMNNAIMSVNTAVWTFTGHELAATFIQFIPYLWVVAVMFFMIQVYMSGGE